jgi:serine/threonine protein kinase
MDVDIPVLASEIRALERKPTNIDPEVEAKHFHDLLELPELREAFSDYDTPRAEGVGGSGLIVSALYKPHDARRAIKVPRYHIYAAGPDGAPRPPDDPELHALSKVSHQHITRLFDSYELPEHRGFCTITELVEGHTPFDVYALRICGSSECRKDIGSREASFRLLATKIFEAADALLHMHRDHSLIHFDVKPDNIIVSDSDHLYISDLGFARDMSRANPLVPVEVGFTFKYAHPDLHDIDKGAVVTSVPEKSKNRLAANKLTPVFDLFAFGRTIQEVLRKLEGVYGDSLYSSYVINYLHIVASLCLDGRLGAAATNTSFVSDYALGMPSAFFRAHKFASFSEVKTSLERLLGYRRLEDEIPELNPWASHTINVSDLGVTALSRRVRSVMAHPSIFRLASERQLGMLDTVFPTATHTRFQHSLGVYHAAREYITALYYDPENPTFRAIFSEQACRRSLLATLVHDSGHSTFGHDLEEVNAEEFSHTEIGAAILTADKPLDVESRRLRDIITGTATDEWNLPLAEVTAVLEGKISLPGDQVYQDILNGAIDADKLDYLIRDSVESRVRYGHGIDHNRFLRSLTTVVESDNDKAVLRLAIKQKGAASAEAFAFARYQLYQSLYWHHTFRAIKAMMITSAVVTIDEIKSKAQLLLGTPFRDAYMQQVIGDGKMPPAIGGKSKKPSIQNEAEMLNDLLRRTDAPVTIGQYSTDRTLQFLWKISNGKPQRLAEDLMERRYYKRILEVSLADIADPIWLRDQVKFKRLAFQRKVEEALLNTLVRKVQDESIIRDSLVEDEASTVVNQAAKGRFSFVIDLPLRGWGMADSIPAFVSDYKRRHFRIGVGALEKGGSESLWSKDLGEMMKRIAFFRVFCEPRLHVVLTRVLKSADIVASINEAFPQFKLRSSPSAS